MLKVKVLVALVVLVEEIPVKEMTNFLVATQCNNLECNQGKLYITYLGSIK